MSSDILFRLTYLCLFITLSAIALNFAFSWLTKKFTNIFQFQSVTRNTRPNSREITSKLDGNILFEYSKMNSIPVRWNEENEIIENSEYIRSEKRETFVLHPVYDFDKKLVRILLLSRDRTAFDIRDIPYSFGSHDETSKTYARFVSIRLEDIAVSSVLSPQTTTSTGVNKLTASFARFAKSERLEGLCVEKIDSPNLARKFTDRVNSNMIRRDVKSVEIEDTSGDVVYTSVRGDKLRISLPKGIVANIEKREVGTSTSTSKFSVRLSRVGPCVEKNHKTLPVIYGHFVTYYLSLFAQNLKPPRIDSAESLRELPNLAWSCNDADDTSPKLYEIV